MRDCVTNSPTGSPFDGLYYILTGTDTLVERSRFERNGIFSETSGSGPSIWPFPGGETATTHQHVATEWLENAAGRGPATYILPGNFVVLYRQCLFRCAPSRLMPSWLHNALIRPIAHVTSQGQHRT